MVFLLDTIIEIQTPKEDSGMSSGDWISLLSAIASIVAIFVGLYQFRRTLQQARIDRLEDAVVARTLRQEDEAAARLLRLEDAKEEREAKLEDARKAWLTNIIIQPKLAMINEFYSKISQHTADSIGVLSNINPGGDSGRAALKTEQRIRAGQVNTIKQQFDYAFVALVGGQNQIFGYKLRELLNELEDIIVVPLGANDYSLVNIQAVEREIYNHKSKLFAALYQEIQQESKPPTADTE
jgi:hypothetical protein